MSLYMSGALLSSLRCVCVCVCVNVKLSCVSGACLVFLKPAFGLLLFIMRNIFYVCVPVGVSLIHIDMCMYLWGGSCAHTNARTRTHTHTPGILWKYSMSVYLPGPHVLPKLSRLSTPYDSKQNKK